MQILTNKKSVTGDVPITDLMIDTFVQNSRSIKPSVFW